MLGRAAARTADSRSGPVNTSFGSLVARCDTQHHCLVYPILKSSIQESEPEAGMPPCAILLGSRPKLLQVVSDGSQLIETFRSRFKIQV